MTDTQEDVARVAGTAQAPEQVETQRGMEREWRVTGNVKRLGIRTFGPEGEGAARRFMESWGHLDGPPLRLETRLVTKWTRAMPENFIGSAGAKFTPDTPIESEEGARVVRTVGTGITSGIAGCAYCGGYHLTTCPRIEEITYHPNGAVKSVKLRPANLPQENPR